MLTRLCEPTPQLLFPLYILSHDIQSEDGVANAADRMEELLELIDGAYDIAEVAGNTGMSIGGARWRRDWLKKARECGAEPSM